MKNFRKLLKAIKPLGIPQEEKNLVMKDILNLQKKGLINDAYCTHKSIDLFDTTFWWNDSKMGHNYYSELNDKLNTKLIYERTQNDH
jgi:hypothetical protein